MRDRTRFLRRWIKKYPDSLVYTLSDSTVADIFFSTLESGFILFRIRCRIRRIRVDGSRIRKEKVADSKISLNSLTTNHVTLATQGVGQSYSKMYGGETLWNEIRIRKCTTLWQRNVITWVILNAEQSTQCVVLWNTGLTYTILLNMFYQTFLRSSTVLISWRRTPNSCERWPQSWSRRKSCFSPTREFILVTTGGVLASHNTFLSLLLNDDAWRPARRLSMRDVPKGSLQRRLESSRA